jgi:hypothetical protein
VKRVTLDEDQIVLSLRELGAAVLPLNIREGERRDAAVNQVRNMALTVGRRHGYTLVARESADCLVVWNRAGDEPLPTEPSGLRGEVAELLARYRAGETLESLGQEWGVTRERIRQLLVKGGLSKEDVEASREARRNEKVREAEVHADELVALYREHGSMRAAATEAAKAFGLTRSVAAAVLERNLTDVDRRAYRGTMNKATRDERRAEYIGYIQTAARLSSEPLGVKEYNKVARFFGWPGHQTLTKYFGEGKWSAACEAAGVVARPPHRGYVRSWTREVCEQAVMRVAEALGAFPTSQEYQFMAEASEGELPSLATVRTRCGTWKEVVQNLMPTWKMSR